MSVDATIIVDDECKIMTLNQAALTTFGYNRWELVGKNISVLMEPVCFDFVNNIASH